ncbi:flagellar basal-body MS-ring/collar protein FliF [Nocardioides sp.]|uniref:flagellar basal-body MS-ring/collar protein FliF n=1 Tax=Nocardioides sp. TaxID=35761 RepID=UPI001A31EA63|nr:flagellar basal-body MS-ring/collar protein FliF [Nocardioides sp.]MBJ7359165.1 flagellar M-ring protein FliF [Nocardioides sp.]
MKDTVQRLFTRGRETFGAFTAGQKAISVLGTVALLLGGFMVFRWASTPDYAPLYSNLSASDVSAVVDQLNTDGVAYELADGGATVMVPQDQVYATRVSLSGEGLPAASDNEGYSILDDQGMSLSQDAQDTNFKRAMEGELSTTIEAIDGVDTAVVHLALPKKEVFADEQEPATASVLVKSRPGATLAAEQVQAVVHLVASSIDGLDPDKVTVADAAGKVLSAPGGAVSDGGAQAQMVSDVQDEYTTKLQTMLDRVLGPGNSTVQVIAALDFDDAVVETKNYTFNEANPPSSSSTTTETYKGAGAPSVGGVVGPDGQMDTSQSTGGASSYREGTTTEDNALDERTERRVSAPGSLSSLHVGVALDADAMTLNGVDIRDVNQLVGATAGIDKERGDTVSINQMAFDRTTEEAAAAELAKAEAAQAADEKRQLYKNIGLAAVVALLGLGAAFAARRRAKKLEETTTYIVEQIRQDHEARLTATQVVELPPAALALAESEDSSTEDLRKEIDDLIQRQPEDVAALMRGWLAERP